MNQQTDLAPQPPGAALLKLSHALLVFSISLVLLVAAVLLFYAVPVWDDLVRATRPVEVGWWGYVYGFVYKHWQGRWASCGLESFILPRVDLTRYYWVLLAAVASVNVFAAYRLCRSFTPHASRLASLTMTGGLLALLWTCMPSVAEVVYWFTGAVENAMVFSLATLLLLSLIKRSNPKPVLRYTEEPDQNSKTPGIPIPTIAALSLAAICICGFHELYGLMLCTCLALGTLAAFSDRTRNRFAWLIITFFAGIGLMIVILAPGNSARFVSDGGPHARHFVYDLKVALAQVRHFIPRWTIDPRLLMASAWVITTPMLRNQRMSSSAFPWRFAVPAVWLLMLAAGFFAPSWAFGTAMPPRTLTGVFITFAIGWLITLHLWSPVITKQLNTQTQFLSALAMLLFSLSLFLPGNGHRAAAEFSHRINPWHSATEDRYARLKNAPGTDALVPPLPTPPTVLLDGEIVNDPADYRNWSTVSYFHLRSIRRIPKDGSTPPPPPSKPTRPPAKGI